MRLLYVLAAALGLAAPAAAQCKVGGYSGGHSGYAPAYRPAYYAPAYQAPAAPTIKTRVVTGSGTDVTVTSTFYGYGYTPFGYHGPYGYAPPVLPLPSVPSTEVIQVRNFVNGAPAGGSDAVKPVPPAH